MAPRLLRGHIQLIGAALAATFLIASCSSGSTPRSTVPDTSAPSGTTAPPTTTTTLPPLPPTTATIGTAGQLRDRLATQGVCLTEGEVSTFEAVPITSAVYCEDGFAILVFPTLTARDQAIDLIATIPCVFPFYIALSDTWIVLPIPPTARRAGLIIDMLGGAVREVPCNYQP